MKNRFLKSLKNQFYSSVKLVYIKITADANKYLILVIIYRVF